MLICEPRLQMGRANVKAVGIPAIAATLILVGAAVLLFARLGHYSLWTDEAVTAITAHGVWQTGDTTAWLNDHNLLTYRDGLLLQHQKDRYTSPLQFYWAAPFIGLLGDSTFACRLPFALCGLGTVILMISWLNKAKPGNAVWIAAGIILLTSASFFLFQRQCRYFALATFLTVLMAYLYCNWNGRRRGLLLIAIVMSLLLTAQYLDYAALVGCLLIDYGIWGRRKHAIRGLNWIVLILPQLVAAAIVCPIWNPIARAASVVTVAGVASVHPVTAAVVPQPWICGFTTMCWWNLRDLVACDFAIVPLLAVCPLLYFHRKNAWLLRAPTALVVFIGVIAFFTAHATAETGNAEVRYLAPLLPLCIGIAILAVWGMQSMPRPIKSILLLVAAASMFVKVDPSHAKAMIHSSAASYYSELLHPAKEPYTPVSSWISQHVAEGATLYICPDWCVAPVMWNVPAPTYVWQLSDPPKPDYAKLPAIYFKGRIAPDYLIAFGPYLIELEHWRTHFAAGGIYYEQAAVIPTYYKEMFRPELIWRSFNTVTPGADEQIFVFRKTKSPAPAD